MLYNCTKCNYITNRLKNLERHYNRKFPCNRTSKADHCILKDTQNHDLNTEKNDPNTEKNDPNTEKNDIDTEKNDIDTEKNNNTFFSLQSRKVFPCFKCSKKFTRKDSMKIHTKICKGNIDPKQCEICLKIFSTTHGRVKHNRKVTCFPSSSIPTNDQQSRTTSNNISNVKCPTINNSTHCNIDNSTTTNNTLNNFYNITDEHIDRIVDKLGEKEYFRIAMNNIAMGKYALPRTAATIYNNKDHPELQTIRKERRNDNLVDVRVGEDEWEKRVFNDVFKLIVRRVEEYYSKYFQHIDEKYKDVPVGSVRWKQLMRPIKIFGNNMLWYDGFHGDTIESMGIELSYPDDDDPNIEKEREKRNREMENLICERLYKETKTLMTSVSDKLNKSLQNF